MAEYVSPDARIFDADFDWEAAAAQDAKPINPIAELARARVSRRDFIKSAIASGAAVSAAGYVFGAAGTAQAQSASAGGRLVSLKVNGQTRRVDVMSQETLAFTLRYKLGLTGTKLGCDRAECGACTVLLDGMPTYSCSMLTLTVRNKAITTIEGVKGKDGGLHPVQKAFVKELSPQCGFCTPGQVMSAVALLKHNPKPTRDEARHAMSGNLCRCGAYENYLDGVMRAAREA
ncbi:MAG: (2Fe-2S)-binding protein [Betaproteobacteria bacterium]|nr:(2Fe-2S)-binding protein [Betaproteobacteria bacterium]